MIRRIRLQNFQSHNLTEITFSKGINAIIGVSDKGKSVIMRGLEWVRTNRPSGEAHISDWAFDAKGKQVEACRVEVENDEHVVERVRNGKTNGYLVDKVLAEAVGTEVPDAVTSALNISNLNVQKQLDGPFLLSQNGGENARFFNSLVNLEEIDWCMSAADSLRRENNRDIATYTKDLEEAQAKVASLSWVDSMRTRLEKLKTLRAEIDALEGTRRAISDAQAIRVRYRGIIDGFSWVPRVASSIARIRRLDAEHSEKYDKRRAVRLLVESRLSLVEAARIRPRVDAADGALQKLRDSIRGVAGVSTRLNQVSALLSQRKASEAALAKAGPLEGALATIEILEGLNQERGTVELRREELRTNLRRRESNLATVTGARRLGALDLTKLQRLVSMRAEKESRKVEVSQILRRRYTQVDTKARAKIEVDTISATLPELCPTCGKPYRSEK